MPTTERAFVICCNDFPDSIVLGSYQTATAKMEERAKEFYERSEARFRYESYEQYRRQCYWHVHSVPVFEEEKA